MEKLPRLNNSKQLDMLTECVQILKGKFRILQLDVRWFLTEKVVYGSGKSVNRGSVFFKSTANFS